MLFHRNLFNNKTLASLDGFKNIKNITACDMEPWNTYVKMYSRSTIVGCDISVCDSREEGEDEWNRNRPNVLKVSVWRVTGGAYKNRIHFKLSSAYGWTLHNNKQSFRELDEVTNYMIDTLKARV